MHISWISDYNGTTMVCKKKFRQLSFGALKEELVCNKEKSLLD